MSLVVFTGSSTKMVIYSEKEKLGIIFQWARFVMCGCRRDGSLDHLDSQRAIYYLIPLPV